MTVSSDIAKSGPYAGNGSTTTFPVTFYFLRNSDVRVVFTDDTGAETDWTEGVEYTITGAGVLSGGTVTVNTTPTDYTPQLNEKLTIVRDMPYTQETDYVSNDPFPAETHETALDEREMEIQQLREKLQRAVTFKISDALVDTEFPTPNAGLAIGWNATEDGLTNLTIADLGTEVLPAVANTYLQRNAGNTMFDSKTNVEVFDDTKQSATESYEGVLEIATQAETDAGTADDKIVTPLKLKNSDVSIFPLPMNTRTGMVLSNDTDTDHDVNITAGKRRSSDDTENIVLSTEITKQIDVDWVAGDDQGGFIPLGTETAVAADSSYPLYAVYGDSTTVDVIIIHSDAIDTTDYTGDTLTGAAITAIQSQTGFSTFTYKYLGSVRTDSSANILPFRQDGNLFWHDNPIEDYNGGIGTTGSLQALTVPIGLKVYANITSTFWAFAPFNLVYGWVLDPDATNNAPSATNYNMGIYQDINNDTKEIAYCDYIRTNTDAEIRHRGTTNLNFRILTKGWFDKRGKE